jgi:hypothetical protein
MPTLLVGPLIAVATMLALLAGGSAQENPSGLPWKSGTTKPLEFGSWRGRPLDLRTVFFGKRDWNHIAASAKTRPNAPMMAIGFPMLPESHRGQLEQCAAGAFDQQMRQVVANMRANGWAGRTFVRLGWEMNRVDRSTFPWAAIGDGSSYVGCFRRWAEFFGEDFVLVWNVANAGSFPFPIDNLYPGDDVVDVIASQYYDRCPPITNQAEWDARASAVDRWGNPAGPNAWRQWALAKGKKWAVPEWGIGGSQTVCGRPGIDNPYFIAQMSRMFWGRRADIAFEAYFNGSDSPTGTHELWPGTANPASADAYRQRW